MKKEIREVKMPEGPLTRRTILDWMGKAVVVGLGSNLLLACGDDDDYDNGEGPMVDAGSDARAGGVFAFEPGSGEQPIYQDWDQNTVDPQDLVEILKSWQLRVDGLVNEPITLSFADLLQVERFDSVADFHCVEGWSVHDVPWNGVHLSTLFEFVQPLSSATHVTFHTVGDQYNESLTIEEALEPKTMLAYGVGGETLPLTHGFPLRLVVPRKYGYKSAKYVYRIELDDKPVNGFWVKYGYPYEADVHESMLRPGKY